MNLLKRLGMAFRRNAGPKEREPDALLLGSAELCAGGADAARRQLVSAIGIDMGGGKFTEIIRAGARIPVGRTEVFSTLSAFQPVVIIHPVAGGKGKAVEKRGFESAVLYDISPAPATVPQIAVTLFVDESGNLWVWGRDSITGSSVPVMELSGLNRYFDSLRRKGRGVSLGRVEVEKTGQSPSGYSLKHAQGSLAGGLPDSDGRVQPAKGQVLIADDNMVPFLGYFVFSIPAERKRKVARFQFCSFPDGPDSPDSVLSLGEVYLEVPGATRQGAVSMFIDIGGTFWVWASDVEGGAPIPVGTSKPPM